MSDVDDEGNMNMLMSHNVLAAVSSMHNLRVPQILQIVGLI